MSLLLEERRGDQIARIQGALDRKRRGVTLEQEAHRLRASFPAFIQAGWPVIIPRPYVHTWHVGSIAEHYQATIEREILNLVCTIQPGSAKSSIISVFGPAWAWLVDASERFVTASYKDTLATRDTGFSRRLMRSDWYQALLFALYGEEAWQFSSDENLKTMYSNTSGGRREMTHVGGGTGVRGSVGQLDDPHNAEEGESESKADMEAAITWFGNTWVSRLDDSVEARAVQIVIGQRIHEDDLIGHILDGPSADRWTHLCLPARYASKHPYVTPAQVKLASGKTIQGDPRVEEDELLAPAYMDEEIYRAKTADMTAGTIASQYQQLPAPREGKILKRANWRYYDPAISYYSERAIFDADVAAELESRVGAFQLIGHFWDTSVKDRAKSDYVAGGVWGCVGASRYLLRIWRARAGLNATCEAMIEMYDWAEPLWPHCPHYIVIENTANGPDAAAQIGSIVQGVITADAKGTKEVRADAASPALDGHNCYLPGWPSLDGSSYDPRTPTDVQEFVEELSAFNTGSHDDQVDMWSSMVLWTRGRTGGATMSVPKGQANPPRFRTEMTTAVRPTLR